MQENRQERCQGDLALLLKNFLDLKGFFLEEKTPRLLSGSPAEVSFALLQLFCRNAKDIEKRGIIL